MTKPVAEIFEEFEREVSRVIIDQKISCLEIDLIFGHVTQKWWIDFGEFVASQYCTGETIIECH